MRRWLALAVLAIPMVCGWSVAKGENTTEGLTAVGYFIDQVPPEISDTAYPVCGRGWYAQINYTWDYEQNLFGECGWDLFMLHYTGFIQIPGGVESVRFGIASDDGSDVTIAGHHFGNWSDKGCSIDYSDRYQLDTNTPLELDAWMYENGGGTCFMLFWQFNGDDQDWQIVPESAFSFAMPTTTTAAPTTSTTTTSTTTTIVLKTTTTTRPPTTTEPPTTTTTSSTSTSTTTSSTSTSTSTTTTTTTVPTTSTTTLPAATTTSTVPIPPEPDFHNAEVVSAISSQIATATATEAATLFDQVDEQSLTPTEAAVLIEAVQAAPLAIRQTFEKHINIYNGTTDVYVPVGSQVNVRARRVIIAVGLVLIVPSVPVRKPDE